MYTADYFIKNLAMTPHPEGGFFKEIFASNDTVLRSKESIQISSEKDASSKAPHIKSKEETEFRKLWTSIYFLLQDGEVSNFHRLKSDEMWYFHAGASLTIYMINPNGEFITEELGLDITKGEKPQVLVPKGTIFGSAMNKNGYSLVGCMVAPGFEFADFELFERNVLLDQYPEFEEVILKLTLETNK